MIEFKSSPIRRTFTSLGELSRSQEESPAIRDLRVA